MLELAEGLARLDRFIDAQRLAIDDRLVQFEPRFAARRRGVRKDLERRGEHRARAEIAKRIGGMLDDLRARGRQCARAREPAPLHVKSVVQHNLNSLRPVGRSSGIPVGAQSRACLLYTSRCV